MKQYINDKGQYYQGSIVIDNVRIINPSEEQILKAGYKEAEEPTPQSYEPTYEEHVESLIRERYTISEELAIQRQRDTKSDEFNEYFDYCEERKSKVKSEE